MHIGSVVPLAGLALALAVPVIAPVATVDRASTEARAARAPLVGLWASQAGTEEGDLLRFYYFHDGGKVGAVDEKAIGLYRYGRVGLNQTNSYDWSVDGDRVRFAFRKTGEVKTARFRVVDEGGVRVLFLDGDPKDVPGTRYVYVPPPAGGDLSSHDDDGGDDDATDAHPFARMWTNARPFATGGMGFAIYQMRPPAIDGRGVGWFHAGDFDDWTTETLTYRRGKGTLELTFPLRHEHAATRVTESSVDGKRVLDLADDPRNFWHRRVYVDGGRAFGDALPLPALPGGLVPFALDDT